MLARWVTRGYLAYLALPIALLLVGSFGSLWLNTLLPTGPTMRWYADVAGDPSFRRAFVSSLVVAASTAAGCLVIGLPLAWGVYRSREPRVRALVRVLTQLPVALPALVLAFGFVLVFSSDTLPWLGSRGLLIAGHLIVCLPYFLHTVLSDMRRLGLELLEDAAESLGAKRWQRLVHVVLPAVRHSMFAGLIVVVALSIGEFQFSNLVAGFLSRTYPIVLLQAFYGATGFACAATVILLVLALAASGLGAFAAYGAARSPALAGVAVPGG